MRTYLAEAVGTFFLVLVGTGAIVVNDLTSGTVTHIGIALAFGCIVMAMIYCLGDISGAHLNPAVTVGFWSARLFPGRKVGFYILCQCLGAISASLVISSCFPEHPNLGNTQPSGGWSQTFIVEVIISFMLMFVILGVSTAGKGQGTMAGIIIGSTVFLAALVFGPISGASMNPARSIGPALISGELGSLWLYIVAPLIGANLAVPGCRCLRGNECCKIKWRETSTEVL